MSVIKQERYPNKQNLNKLYKSGRANLLKAILRGFRESMKDQFTALHGEKYFYWIQNRKRKEIRKLFTKEYNIDDEFYN